MNTGLDFLFNTDIDPEVAASIFELSSEVIWVLQGEKHMCYASKENKKKFNIPNALPSDFWISHIHPDDKERVLENFSNALKNKKVFFFEHEYRFRGKGENYYHILAKLKFIRNTAGIPVSFISVWKDISEVVRKQKKLEETLSAMEIDRSRFKLISEMSNAAMWELDLASGKINWFAGSNALEEFGLNKGSYTHKDWEESIHPEDRERVTRYFNYIITSGSQKICGCLSRQKSWRHLCMDDGSGNDHSR